MHRTIADRVCTILLLAASHLTAADAPAPTLSCGIDRSGLDTSVRPQDDFYRYENGG